MVSDPKRASPRPVAWEMFEREGGGAFHVCGVDGDALDHAPISTLPFACEVTIQAESAEPAALGATETQLDTITAELGGRIVATERTRTRLIVLAYLPSDDGVARFTEVSLPRSASISVAPANDPAWTMFDWARPVAIEQQSMLDFRVRRQLHARGDVGGEREMEHFVVGLTPGTVDEFMTSIRSAIGDIRSSDDARLEMWTLVHVADPKDVTEYSWMIRQIAERYGADYDGWGCSVESATAPERKGRWFR